jgi:hypothetical protein
MRRDALGLAAILLAGAALRLGGIGWGVPRYDGGLAQGTALRTSYHLDEDKVLWPLAVGQGGQRSYWGALTTHLTRAALFAAERAGVFGGPWRRAFLEPTDRLRAVFVTGRLLSVAFALGTIAIVWAWARGRAGAAAASMAAALLALSPLHVVHAHFLTPDVALAFWIALGLWLLERGSPWGGAALGLALATKGSALFALPALLFLGRRRAAWAATAAALGLLAGDPAIVAHARDVAVGGLRLARESGPGAPLAMAHMCGVQAWQVAYYGLGFLGLGFALAGLRRTPRGTRWALAALFLSLGLSHVPVARYALPLLPILAVGAGAALAGSRPRWRLLLGAAALLPPLLLGLGQAGLLADEHTAQRAGDWVARNAPAGATVAQVWPECPLLDARRVTPVVLHTRATAPAGEPRLAADFVVLDDLRLEAFTAETRDALARDYEPVAVFTRPPRLGPLVVPEPWPAHDWRYTHPALTILRRRER